MSQHVMNLESVCEEREVGERLHSIRVELYGEHGLLELTEHLGISPKTWRRYEAGKLMPVGVMLGFVERTGVRLDWLMNGEGPKFSGSCASSDSNPEQPVFQDAYPFERPRFRVVTGTTEEGSAETSAEVEAARAQLVALKEQLDSVQGQSARSRDEIRYLRELCGKMKTRSAAVKAARDEAEGLRRLLEAERIEAQRLRAELDRKQEERTTATTSDPKSAFLQHLQQIHERDLQGSTQRRPTLPLVEMLHRG